MKSLLAIAALSFLIACGGGTPESEPKLDDVAIAPATMPLTEDAVADMGVPAMADQLIMDGQILSDLLATVNSAETAQAARPDIEAMMSGYQLMLDRFESMDQPSFSDLSALASRGSQLAKTQQSVMEEVRRIYTQHPDAADALRDTLNEFGRP